MSKFSENGYGKIAVTAVITLLTGLLIGGMLGGGSSTADAVQNQAIEQNRQEIGLLREAMQQVATRDDLAAMEGRLIREFSKKDGG